MEPPPTHPPLPPPTPEIFAKRWVFRFFPQGLVKKGGGVLKGGGSLIFIQSNPFQCYLSLGVSCVCFVYFTLVLLVLFVFHRKNLVLLNLIIRYMTSTSE